jgi:hypothetical protein
MDKLEQKELAVRCLEMLDIYKPYIRKFKSAATMPCFFENFGGFWVDQEPELYSKIKEVEAETGCLVYAVTHEIIDNCEMWTMLCVPSECAGVEDIIGAFNTGEYYVFSYAWNKTIPWCSEFGDSVVRTFGGGIKRI